MKLAKIAKAKTISVRAMKVRNPREYDPLDAITPGVTGTGRAMNKPETLITRALDELKIRNIPQFSILGGDILGGARMDWFLPDYRLDIEYSSPFHESGYAKVRDALRNIGVSRAGVRTVLLYYHDLFRIKPRLLEIVGRKG